MIDFKHLRQNPELYKQACKNKNSNVNIDDLISLGDKRGQLQEKIDGIKQQANALAQSVKQVGKPTTDQIEQGKKYKQELKGIEEEFAGLDLKFIDLLEKVPNLPSGDTPVGPNENSNKVLRQWGTIRDFKAEGFEPKEHWQLGTDLDVIDIERASKVSGTRFAYLKGDLALLQFALIQFGMEKLTDAKFIEEIIKEKNLEISAKPFTPIIPPVLIRPEPFKQMARIEPKEERYYIPSDDIFLIGSAEHTLGAMHIGETFEEKEMPVRYVGYSTSFRREAGSYGKDTKGILRVHQFDKLEMESFSTGETSLKEQELLVGIQEKLMQMLNIPYEVMICATGDQGDPDARHIDINSWLPGQNQYRETHSADLMTDYQTRRMNVKVKRSETGEKELVHTNDATAFAIGRTLIAIMENYQQKDGSILIPEVLRKYINKDRITKAGK